MSADIDVCAKVRTIREVARERADLSEEEPDMLLEMRKMTDV